MRSVIVVGAGFGGIAAALRARAKGFNVTIVDRCSRLGGRAQVFERGGFKHDAGPTVITAPFLIEELFDLFDKKMCDYLKLVPLDPWYRFVFPDGREFNYGGTVESTLAEIRKFNPDDCDNYLRLVEASRQIFDTGFTELSDQPFHNVTKMFTAIPDLMRLKSYKRAIYLLLSAGSILATSFFYSAASCWRQSF